MDTRICSTCHIEKPLTDFPWRNKAKGTRRAQCGLCKKAAEATRAVVTYTGPRICTKCQIEQPATSFHWRRKVKGMRHPRCITCQKAADAARRPRHDVSPKDPDGPRVCSTCHLEQPINEFDWSRKAKGKRQARCKTCRAAYRLEHLETIRVKDAAYYLAHKEELKQARRDYYAENTEQILLQMAQYARENKEIFQACNVRRRARKNAAPINDLTPAQFLEVCQDFNFRCAYCPVTCKACKAKTHKLTQEHITSFAEKGSHTLWNVVPACQRCNSKKGTKQAPVFVQPLLLTLAPPRKDTKH